MNIINKIIGIVVAGFMLTAAQGFAAAPGPGSASVISTLNPWFVLGGAMDNPGVPHFNFDPMYKGAPLAQYWSETAAGLTDGHVWVYQSGSPLVPYNAVLAAGPVTPPSLATPWSYTAPVNSAADVRVYFVDNQAGYRNALGATINNAPIQPIFPSVANTASPPSINLGDMVEFTVGAGSTLNFELLTNISAPMTAGSYIWNTNPLLNTDQYGNSTLTTEEHFHFYSIPELYASADFAGRSNYLVSSEDLAFGSADLDFNDMIFLLSITPIVPEPRIYILLGSLLALALMVARKRQKENV
jgi:hypothetical protein